MAVDLDQKDWLAALVDEELVARDPEAARARLPAEIRPGPLGVDLEPGVRVLVARSLRQRRLGPGSPSTEATFLETVRGHVALLLDLSLLAGDPFRKGRSRASIACCLAAALGETDMALDADPAHPDSASHLAVQRALRATGKALRARFYPPGDPLHGLPLYPGTVAVLRRHLARVTMGAHRTGSLDPEALARHRAFAQRELVLLVEALAGLLEAAGPAADASARAVRVRQVQRLGLPRAETREARRALQAARPAGVLAAATPPRVRPFLLEQLLLAQLRAGLPAAAATRFTDAFAAGAGFDAEVLAAAQVEAAAQHDDHLAWFEAVGSGQDWQKLADAWEATADQVVEKVSDAVTENLEAVMTEVRETGELGQLLAKAASGRTLTGVEKRKVKEQLIDLAKAVPALAIFAAPGGMLLLPLLAKLLPFNVLPSSWDKDRKAAGAAADPAPGAEAGAEGAREGGAEASGGAEPSGDRARADAAPEPTAAPRTRRR